MVAAGKLLRDVAQAAAALGSAKDLHVACSLPDRPIEHPRRS